jgi:hypothetical protein
MPVLKTHWVVGVEGGGATQKRNYEARNHIVEGLALGKL